MTAMSPYGTGYYNMKGEQITFDESMKYWRDSEKRRVAFTRLPNGYRISTVLLTFDHGFGGERPIIFESMVFHENSERGHDFDMDRYCTHEEALEGHDRLVARYRNEPPPKQEKKP